MFELISTNRNVVITITMLALMADVNYTEPFPPTLSNTNITKYTRDIFLLQISVEIMIEKQKTLMPIVLP